MLKENLFRFNKYTIFIGSILICLIFFYFEKVIGIDKFYHPDSIEYLKVQEHFLFFSKNFLNNPKSLFSTGYYYISTALDHNYLNLIFLNFLLFATTNLMVFNLIFKNHLKNLNKFQLLILLTILLFDPYRLHLASHVLKETILIFLIISFLYFHNILIKFLILIFSVFIKKNIIFFFLFLFTNKLFKKFFSMKNKNIIITALLSILFIFIFFNFKISGYIFHGNDSAVGSETIFGFFNDTSVSFLKTLELWHYRDMGGREYDNIPNFQNLNLFMGILLKIIIWPSLIFSGLFLFFTSSILFKSLGIMMIYFNIVIYYISKKTYMSLGLLILLILIALYSSTFTSYFRYSYVAIYCAIIIFFNNYFKCQKK